MRRYSQNNEQEVVLRGFGRAKGTFLDIGANDGETLSNSRALALRGWSGVCVEPSPSAFQRLHGLYRNAADIECHNVALCAGSGPAILHESGSHLGSGDVALLSTAKAVEMERWAGATFTPTPMECVTFDELLSRSKFKHFDFITMDIEGMEMEVLTQIDLIQVGCKMLIVEVNDRDQAPYVEHCRSHAMRLHSRNAENLIFVR